MAKKRKTKVKTPTVKRVKLKPGMVLEVGAPPGVAPAIVPRPERNAVEIVAVPAAKSWWRSLFKGDNP